MTDKYNIAYVTSSEYKKDEFEIIRAELVLDDGTSFADLRFSIQIYNGTIRESLEASIEQLAKEEVFSAYQKIRIPCIVEHAGLIFNDIGEEYPGGLTKPMWNTLKDDKFISETQACKREVTARAVIAYCDGMQIHSFIGETKGFLAQEPRGERKYYWDTIFIPEENNPDKKTYAEIIRDQGLSEKVLKYSQSTKAFKKFLEFVHKEKTPQLWL